MEMTVQKSDKKINVNGVDFCHVWIIKDSVKYVLVRGAEEDKDGGIPLSQMADNEYSNKIYDTYNIH